MARGNKVEGTGFLERPLGVSILRPENGTESVRQVVLFGRHTASGGTHIELLICHIRSAQSSTGQFRVSLLNSGISPVLSKCWDEMGS